MSDDRPDPMTPPDCDLRGYEWMPLLGHRLFASTIYVQGRKQPRAFMAALRLWWEAWNQVPAASLPDDDDVLAELAGFGENTKAWQRYRVLAMHGFVRCSDGRWYHAVLAAEAVKAYENRLKSKDKREADAERLRRWRQEQRQRKGNGETPDETRFDTHVETPHETVDETHETGQDRTGQEKKEDTPPLPRPAGAGPGRRADGTNPRSVGTNPRATGTNPRATGDNPRLQGTSPRQTGTNPKAKRPFRNGAFTVIYNDQLSDAQQRDLDDWTRWQERQQQRLGSSNDDQGGGGEQCLRIRAPFVTG